MVAVVVAFAFIPAATVIACRQQTPPGPQVPVASASGAPSAAPCPTTKTCDGTNEKCTDSDCRYCHHCKIGSCDKADCTKGQCTCQGTDYHNQWNAYCMSRDAGAC